MATYQDILTEFFRIEKIGEYSLDPITRACAYFGNPQDTFKSIHIAGTNGKGSVSKMIFQMLKESGRRAGVYTSPHNTTIRERFETDNGLINETDFARYAQMILAYPETLSYFEKCVLLAFLYFRDQGCEYTVIEVGMGGRLDATNILHPILSIITSIGYDHMEFLGYTLEQIATEKGGIIKPNTPVILYDKNNTLESIAYSKHAPIIFPKKRDINTNLLGEHQLSNARIAYEAGIALGLDPMVIIDALLHVEHSGRMQYLRPNLLIDGAHNKDGLRSLQRYIDTQGSQWDQIIYCINIKKGKEPDTLLDIFGDVGYFVVVDTESPQVTEAGILVHKLQEKGREIATMTAQDITRKAGEELRTLFVVFGSLYMIGDFYVNNEGSAYRQ